MIEIISRKFKPTETDQNFMDWCAEVDHNEPKTWYNHTIEDIVAMEYNELIKAIKENDYEHIETNVIHLSVALLRMWRKIHNVRVKSS